MSVLHSFLRTKKNVVSKNKGETGRKEGKKEEAGLIFAIYTL